MELPADEHPDADSDDNASAKVTNSADKILIDLMFVLLKGGEIAM